MPTRDKQIGQRASAETRGFRLLTAASFSYLVFERFYETAATVSSSVLNDQRPNVFLVTITNNSHLFPIKNVVWFCFSEHLKRSALWTNIAARADHYGRMRCARLPARLLPRPGAAAMAGSGAVPADHAVDGQRGDPGFRLDRHPRARRCWRSGLEPVKLLYSETAVVIGIVNIFVPLMVLPIMASIERISPSLEEAAQNLGASGEHVARDAKRRPVKLASSGLRTAHAGANGCASIDGYEVA
jgi:hypothetical protein